MEIIRIFEQENQGLYSCRYAGDTNDAFNTLFENWIDMEYLENFFESNKSDLLSGFFGQITVVKAVIDTHSDSRELRNKIISCYENKNELDSIFTPLDRISYKPDEPEKRKAYGINTKWLRVYALKIEENTYIVTGGSIKLTATMQERPHTQKELNKLQTCIDYLKQSGIFDKDGLAD